MNEEFGKILLPIDGSENAKKAAQKACFIAKNTGLPIEAICILDPLRYSFAPEIISHHNKIARDLANSYLEEIKKIGEQMDVKINSRLIDGKTPFEEIIENVGENDLIVMGKKGKSGLGRVLMGSVSEKVVRHAPCTVMIVK